MQRLGRRVPNELAPREHRSMPNLREMNEVQRTVYVAQAGDYRYTLNDFVPELEHERRHLRSRVKTILINSAKTGFVGLVLLNLVSVLVDPTLFENKPNIFPTFHSNSEYHHAQVHLTEIMTAIEEKLTSLEEQVNELKIEYTNFSAWKNDLEYEVLNEFSKSKMDTLEYISNLEQKMVNALSLYDADKLGIIDYALESAGGTIISTPDTTPYPSQITYVIMGVVKVYASSDPKLLIQPGILPGQCFAFHGHTGNVRIRLAQLIQINSVTLEHTHKNLASDITSCPKDFKVFGLRNLQDEEKIVEMSDLGTFTYAMNGSTLQNFKVNRDFAMFEYVELKVLNNYGNNYYTCIYRFRVHGRPV